MLGKQCGDRYIRPGDYASIHGILDYHPCSTGLSDQVIADSAKALRSNPDFVPRLRIAKIETRLVDLAGNNRTILENLRAIANEQP